MPSAVTRLHDFDIGLTDVSPSVQTPSPSNYQICRHVEGVFPSSDTISCVDPFTTGRYLVIRIAGAGQILTLCEVQVRSTTNGEYGVRSIKNIKKAFKSIQNIKKNQASRKFC